MAKLTAEQRAELEAQLADDDDGDDFDFEYTEGDRSIRLPWSQRDTLHEFGFKGRPKAAPKAPAKTEGTPRNVSVFGPRRTGS
jgi:hypothetical protein